MDLAGLCSTFDIRDKIDEELFAYIDNKQKEVLTQLKDSYQKDKDYELYVKLGMSQFCQSLLESRVDGYIKYPDWSYQNNYIVVVEDHKLTIFWKLHNPTVQKLKYEYDL